jgi:hypothetical protein
LARAASAHIFVVLLGSTLPVVKAVSAMKKKVVFVNTNALFEQCCIGRTVVIIYEFRVWLGWLGWSGTAGYCWVCGGAALG